MFTEILVHKDQQLWGRQKKTHSPSGFEEFVQFHEVFADQLFESSKRHVTRLHSFAVLFSTTETPISTYKCIVIAVFHVNFLSSLLKINAKKFALP